MSIKIITVINITQKVIEQPHELEKILMEMQSKEGIEHKLAGMKPYSFFVKFNGIEHESLLGMVKYWEEVFTNDLQVCAEIHFL